MPKGNTSLTTIWKPIITNKLILTYMRHLLISLMLLCFLPQAKAQIETITQVIEPALLECRYQWTQKTDTLGTGIAVDTMVLRIGKNVSQCYPQSTFSMDSLVNTPNGGEIFMQLTMDFIRKKGPRPGTKIINEYYYKNYPEGKLTTWVTKLIAYQIEEKYEKQPWILIEDSIKTINNYQCRLAVCKFHGREYKAWYTNELPYQDGPWKFNGLPGLITEVYDTKDHYHFTLVSVRQENLFPVCFYDIRNSSQSQGEKIDRISYLKQSAENNPYMHGKKKDSRGNTIAYDYMETDYHTH